MVSGSRSRNSSQTHELHDNFIMKFKKVDNSLSFSKTNSTDDSEVVVTDGASTAPSSSISNKGEYFESTHAAYITTPSTTPALIGMVNKVWDGFLVKLGVKKPTCLNGGKLKPNGTCDCLRYYNGTSCEKKQCLNGGVLHKNTSGPVTYECQCPNSLYIEGEFCQNVKCDNGGILLLQNNGSWNCDCSQNLLYKGTFCEKFSPPMGIAIPLIIAFIFLLCCALCRIDWCPRKQSDRRRSTRSTRSQNQHSTRRISSNLERRNIAQPTRLDVVNEHLLQEVSGRNPVAFPSHGNPYVIRLDTIPAFNPNMIGGVEPTVTGPSGKPMEPPPPYEQAVRAPLMRDPPRYTERLENVTSTPRSSVPLHS